MAFNAKGDRFVSGSGNGVIRVWDTLSNETVARFEELRGVTITGLSISPFGKMVAACGKGKVGLWIDLDVKLGRATESDTSSGATKSESKFRFVNVQNTDSEAAYSGVAITGDGKDLYIARRHLGINNPGRLVRYDIDRDIVIEQPGPKFFDPRAVASIPDPESSVVAVYGAIDKGEAAILLYGLGDVRTITHGVPPLSHDAHHRLPQRITFSTDGYWLAAYSGTLAVWPVPGSQIITGNPATLNNVFAAAIGPNNIMATVGPPSEYQNAEVTLWKLDYNSREYGLFGAHWVKPSVDIKKLSSFSTKLREVGTLAFNPTGKLLAAGGITDGLVQIWNLK
jgi:WD40 repeat protein